jgi:hypothetical protein
MCNMLILTVTRSASDYGLQVRHAAIAVTNFTSCASTSGYCIRWTAHCAGTLFNELLLYLKSRFHKQSKIFICLFKKIDVKQEGPCVAGTCCLLDG